MLSVHGATLLGIDAVPVEVEVRLQRGLMGKFLVEAKYSSDGIQGVRKEGAEARIRAISTLIESLGGSMESFYFAFGDTDAYVTVDLPDDETAAALALAVEASGLVSLTTTKLLTGSQVDMAFAKTVAYRAPGT